MMKWSDADKAAFVRDMRGCVYRVGRDYVVLDMPSGVITLEGAEAARVWRKRRAGRDQLWLRTLLRWRMELGVFDEDVEQEKEQMQKPEQGDVLVMRWTGSGYYGEDAVDCVLHQEQVRALNRKGLVTTEVLSLISGMGCSVYGNGDAVLFLDVSRKVADELMSQFIGYIKYNVNCKLMHKGA